MIFPSRFFVRSLICAFIFLTSTAFAQKPPMKFGKVEDADVKMKTFPKDPDASAVILCDYGDVFFEAADDGLQLVYYRHRRIKILNKAGFDFADVTIPYYYDNKVATVENIKAQTYYLNEKGSVQEVKLDKKEVIDEDLNGVWHQKKFTLPGIQEGAVIEYTYRVVSQSHSTFPDWYFQTSEPTLWSEFRTRIPNFYTYVNYFQGGVPLDIRESKKYSEDMTFNQKGNIRNTDRDFNQIGSTKATYEIIGNDSRYVIQNVPALRSEPYITTMSDHYAMMGTQLQETHFPGQSVNVYMSDWATVNRELLELDNFGKQLNRNKDLKEKAASLVAGLSDNEEKVATIYSFVTQTMEWNGIYSVMASQKLDKCYEERSGRSGELNLMLVLMLREAGIDAYPVMTSTRSHGRMLPVYPFLDQFNHTLAYVVVGEKGMFLDATSSLRPPGMLGTNHLNGRGFLVAEKGADWVNIPATTEHRHSCSAILNLTEEGTLTGKLQTSDDGYSALEKRQAFLSDGKAAFLKNHLEAEMTDVTIQEATFENEKMISDAFKMSCEVNIADFVQDAGDMLYLSPMLHEAQSENPFKLETRTFDVDLAYPLSDNFTLTLTLPEGYQVETLPEPIRLSLPEKGGNFTYMAQLNGNTLQVISKVSLKQVVFKPEEYAGIKEFFDIIVAKHAEQVVLKKL